MRSKLALNTAWMTLGQGAYAACQWAALVVLARLQGPELVGEYALALAITAPVMIFSQLQMRQVFVTDVADQYRFGEYLLVRSAATGLACLFILLFALVGGFAEGAIAVILAVTILKACENLSDLFYGLAQRHERLDLIGISLALRGSLGVAALALGFYLSGQLVVGVLAMAASWALVLVAFDRRATGRWRAPRGSVRLAWSDLRRGFDLVKLGLPLGATVMLVSLNTNLPNYFVAGHQGERSLGALAAMAYFVSAGDLVVNAIGQAATVRLATCFATGALAAFYRLLGLMVLASALLGAAGLVVILVLGAAILQRLYGGEFVQYADLFAWVMLAGAVGYLATPLGYGLTAMRSFQVQPLILGLVIIVNFISCYLLVPRLGLAGAVWAWTGSRLCQVALLAWAGERRLRAGRAVMAASRPLAPAQPSELPGLDEGRHG